MDKNGIERFAAWARKELLTRVIQRANLYNITEGILPSEKEDIINGRVLSQTEKRQIQALVRRIKREGFEQVMEEVAYTWFNRFIAIRYMEVNGYLPTHVRVFTNERNEFKPQILDEAINLELDGLDMKKVYEYKEKNQEDELFKYLLVTQCNALNSILPYMFQTIEDYSELLIPDYLLREGSVIDQMICQIPEEDWTDQVQIVGWLFEGYAAVNREIMRKEVKVTKKSMATVNQVFTPDWIVRYMIENTIGKIWMKSHPDSELLKSMKYYVNDSDSSDADRKLNIEDVHFIEPCCGSGHVLVYAFDLLASIYEELGYTKREIPEMIINNNLWGFDIDKRAAQLAYFALMMKARSMDRRALSRGLNPKIYEYIDSTEVDKNCIVYVRDCLAPEYVEITEYLLKQFEHGKVLGTATVFEKKDYCGYIDAVSREMEEMHDLISMVFWENDAKVLIHMARIAEALSNKYDVMITNPPYSFISKLEDAPKAYILDKYPSSNAKCNLCSVFLESRLVKPDGFMAMITSMLWTKQKSFEDVRKTIINDYHIDSMLFIGADEVNAMVETVAFVLNHQQFDSKGKYYSLKNVLNRSGFIDSIEPNLINQQDFLKSPSSIINELYSESDILRYTEMKSLKDVMVSRDGLHTCNNDLFLRLWHEVDISKTAFGCKNKEEAVTSNKKWFPYCKGGDYRKWYGNNEYVINWENDGYDIKNLKNENGKVIAHNFNGELAFKEGVTWSYRSSVGFAIRYSEEGYLFDSKGSKAFMKDGSDIIPIAGLLNSVVGKKYISDFATTAFEVGTVLKVPYTDIVETDSEVKALSSECIDLARAEWNSFETSWDFEKHPLINGSSHIAESYKQWEEECNYRFEQLISNEEALNTVLINVYGLQNELSADVDLDDVIIRMRRADLVRDIKSFISYAVGCMFGRYSLDVDSLAFAGGEFDPSKYSTYIPDSDNIIPICDDEYFEDDIVGRFVDFVKVVYGADTLEENLKFIADALGGKGTSREIIRSYFLNGFFADHCKMYQKKPIYWLFDSGKKNGFKCLIYMHRYQPDTIARIRTDYVHEIQSKFRTILSQINNNSNEVSSGEKLKLAKKYQKLMEQSDEVLDFEAKIHHLADQMISIDLDDGVKVNYAKFQDVLAKVK